ncbi:MAG: M20/M25/M40 family metallo-hydrolase [Oligoflexia bacterium]|nr:M20/M25/M40 family metallo-hydrolase [Oligoflexia bacterium]
MINSNLIPTSLTQGLPRNFFDELGKLLAFKSISSDTAYKADCKACAKWLIEFLAELPGLEVRPIETAGNPLIFAQTKQRPGLPTLLVYGHYDVQPPGDRDTWLADPFEAQVRGERLFARGARDNKGQTFFWLVALREALHANSLAWNVKVLLDGEEESGSSSLLSELKRLVPELSAHVIAASETAGFDSADPALIMGLRGAAILRFSIHGASRELHSGNHGGRVPNPAVAIAQMLGKLHDESGKVAVPGFYSKVQPVSPTQRELLAQIPFDSAAYARNIGVSELSGELQFNALERVFFRPTLEVHSIHSGFSGPGIKTSIPIEAQAVLSMRLVANQEPQEELDRLVSFLQSQVPVGCRVEFLMQRAIARPTSADPRADLYTRTGALLRKFNSKAPVFLWSGASLPVIAEIQNIVKAQPLLVGFGTADDNEHGPNESFLLGQYVKGFTFARALLETDYSGSFPTKVE